MAGQQPSQLLPTALLTTVSTKWLAARVAVEVLVVAVVVEMVNSAVAAAVVVTSADAAMANSVVVAVSAALASLEAVVAAAAVVVEALVEALRVLPLLPVLRKICGIKRAHLLLL